MLPLPKHEGDGSSWSWSRDNDHLADVATINNDDYPRELSLKPRGTYKQDNCPGRSSLGLTIVVTGYLREPPLPCIPISGAPLGDRAGGLARCTTHRLSRPEKGTGQRHRAQWPQKAMARRICPRPPAQEIRRSNRKTWTLPERRRWKPPNRFKGGLDPI